MSFPSGKKRSPEEQKKAAIIAMAVAIAAAVQGVMVGAGRRGTRHLGTGDIGSIQTLAIFGALIAVPVIIFIIVKLRSSGDDDDHARTEDPSDSSMSRADDGSRESADDSPLKYVLLAVIVVLGIVAALLVMSDKARAQGTSDRGAFILVSGNDTLIVDRFSRTPHLLSGTLYIKGQARVEYIVSLGDDELVRSLNIRQYKWSATPAEAPAMEVVTTMQGDSALIDMAGKTTRLASKRGAIPSVNNALAITELFTRRAHATGGSGDFWYLAINGGMTLPLTVRPIASDSALLTIAGQQEHLKIDGDGRILGGAITGQPALMKRVSSDDADRIVLALTVAASRVPDKPDYSAPANAPYTAEEVSFKGPGGITLGGTLTKPKNAKGPLPVAVTITGSGQEDRDEYIPFAGGIRLFRQVADTLSRVGIAVLRLDDRGLGGSTGNFAASNTADFADDTRAAVEWLRTRPDIDASRIALIGHSEGGMIAPMVSATDPKIKAIVILAGPGDSMYDIIIAQNQWSVDHAPNLSKTQRDSLMKMAHEMLMPEKQTAPAMKFWMGYDPAPTAKKVRAATLILQGATDRQVPPANAEKLAGFIRSNGNKDVTVKVFPATNHLFVADSTGDPATYAQLKVNKVSPAIMGAMADWLVLKLGLK